jgi:hypothetical protein
VHVVSLSRLSINISLWVGEFVEEGGLNTVYKGSNRLRTFPASSKPKIKIRLEIEDPIVKKNYSWVIVVYQFRGILEYNVGFTWHYLY